MKLSKRLKTVAAFVPEGCRLADVGTDHGYVPIYLMQEEKVSHAIAMDVRPGPLKRAQDHIRAAGLEDQISVRLSDGLLKLKPGEADCVVIAGMGGELVIHILEEGRFLWDHIRYWVLSPHSEIDKVRRFLEKESFSVEKETMLEEEGKYYTVMGFVKTKGDSGRMFREIDYRYGRHLLESKNPVLLKFLKKEQEETEKLLKGLNESGSRKAEQRIPELKRALAWNKEAQDEMQGIDSNS